MHVIVCPDDVEQSQPGAVTGPTRVSSGTSVSVTVTRPEVGPAPTLPTVIV